MSRPAPGTTLSQRRDFLYNQATRFIEIRNLAYLDYKNSDGQPLMTYEETLTDRDVVREKILNYELANGLIVNDGTAGQAVPNTPTMNPEVHNMSQFTPPPAPFSPPTGGTPAPATSFSPAPAPSAPQASGPQPEVQAPPTSGRGRRKAPGSGGTAVAPPPAAPPPAPEASAPTFAPLPAPGFSAPQAPGFTPPAAPSFTPPTAPATSAPATVGVDLTPVLQRLDAIGTGFESLSKQVDDLKAGSAALSKQNEQLMGALFALAQTNQATAGWIAQANNGKAPDFATFKAFSAYLAGIPQ